MAGCNEAEAFGGTERKQQKCAACTQRYTYLAKLGETAGIEPHMHQNTGNVAQKNDR
jgi:hypothetical protein